MKRLLLILAGLFALASCDKSHEPDFTPKMRDVESATNQPTDKRSLEEVQALALGITNQLRSGGMRSATPLYISSTRPIERAVGGFRSLSEGSTEVYVVQFADNQGYALVSANRGDDGVLYIADSGEFDPEFNDRFLDHPVQRYMAAYGFGFRCPYGYGCADPMQCAATNHPEPWRCPKGCKNPENCSHIFNPLPEPTKPKGRVIRGVDNLLKTNWHLWYPFNDKAPEVDYIKIIRDDKTGEIIEQVWDKAKAYIGCVAVAALQVLAYYQYPKQLGEFHVPWDRFRTMDRFYGEDAELISCVAKYVADELDSKYGADNSLETYSSDYKLYKFLTRIGYKNYKNVKYDFNLVVQELEKGHPILIGASIKGAYGGHLWLLDGYKEMVYVYRPELTLVHCNWGWGKDANKGYCLSELWSSGLSIADPEYPDIPKRTEKTRVYSEGCEISIGLEPNQ